jgi:hypothetical protein
MPHELHELSAEPLVYYLDAFATPAECRHLVSRASAALEPALVEADGSGLALPIRTGSACWPGLLSQGVPGSHRTPSHPTRFPWTLVR